MTNLLLGVGNIFRADDGIGPYLAELAAGKNLPDWKIFNAGTAPENFTGVVRKLHPKLLVIVDAAEMSLPAGSIRIISEEKIRDTTIGTHMMALSHLVRFLSDAADETLVIGVQPKVLADFEGLSLEAVRAAEEIFSAMHSGTVASFSKL